MPRRYRMRKRADAVLETRRRILDATMTLHAAQGIQATTWEDIAERAGVSIATVYRHFATVDELVPACGHLTDETIRPPRAEDAEDLLRGADDVEERLRRVIDACCAFYQRGASVVLAVWGERNAVPAVQEWLDDKEAARLALIQAALDPAHPDPATGRLAAGLTGLLPWQGLADQGVAIRERPAILLASVLGNLERRDRVQRSSGKRTGGTGAGRR